MRPALPNLCAAVALLALSGCGLMGSSSTPPITLQAALVQTVDALAASRAEAQVKGEAGFYACTLTASFNVQATTSQSGSVALAVSPTVGSLTSSLSGAASSSQGDQVTVLLASPLCAPSVALKTVNSNAQPAAAPTALPLMAPLPKG